MIPSQFDPYGIGEPFATISPAEPVAPPEPPTREESRIAQRRHVLEGAAVLAGFGPHVDANGPFGNGFRILVGKLAARRVADLGVDLAEFMEAFCAALVDISPDPASIPARRPGSPVREIPCRLTGSTSFVRFTVNAGEILIIHIGR